MCMQPWFFSMGRLHLGHGFVLAMIHVRFSLSAEFFSSQRLTVAQLTGRCASSWHEKQYVPEQLQSTSSGLHTMENASHGELISIQDLPIANSSKDNQQLDACDGMKGESIHKEKRYVPEQLQSTSSGLHTRGKSAQCKQWNERRISTHREAVGARAAAEDVELISIQAME